MRDLTRRPREICEYPAVRSPRLEPLQVARRVAPAEPPVDFGGPRAAPPTVY